MSKGITIGTDGPTTESVTLEGVDQLKTVKVGDSGQVYVGKQYAGEQVMLAVRVEQDDETETDDTESDDSDN